jgi:hypothetical protein
VAQGEAEELDGRRGSLATADQRVAAGSLIVAAAASRTSAPCGRLPAVSLLTELDAFYLEHRPCGDLDAGVDWPVVWIECGATMARRVDEKDAPLQTLILSGPSARRGGADGVPIERARRPGRPSKLNDGADFKGEGWAGDVSTCPGEHIMRLPVLDVVLCL